jgi:hypothetical protein
VITETVGTDFRLIIRNTAPAAKFVYGSLAVNVNQARRFQQRFHRRTGWPEASPIVQRWLVEYREELAAQLVNDFQTTFTGRAYTAPRRS